jgi:hypothetical protein
MTPRQYFDEVAEENARLAIADRGDLRRSINAILTLDALFGILHAALYKAGVVSEPNDDGWKEQKAQQSAEYRLLRDTAYALKHGQLNRGKTRRIVRRPDQLFTMPGAFDSAAFDPEAFESEQVWIETEMTDYAANEIIEKVAEFARLELTKHGI